MQIDIEYTDTFGGEANYGWVRRATAEVPDYSSNLAIMRAAKAEMGLTGVRGETTEHGDDLEFRPYDRNTVLFVTFPD